VPGKKEKLPLSVTHPELAKEADGWDPATVTAGSNKKKPLRYLGDISRAAVQIPARSKLTTGGLL
jgi:hypothetical protein